MAAFVSLTLMILGGWFMLSAAIGIVRMPDLFMRMHFNSKSVTLGVACMIGGAAVHFGEFSTALRAGAVVVFLFFTAPVSAHLLGRAAYFSENPLWHGTQSDDLRGRYDTETHVLTSPEEFRNPRQT